MNDIRIIIKKTSDGCSAYVEGIKKNGITSFGKNIPEALRNMADAFELHEKYTIKIKMKPRYGIVGGVKRNPVRK